MHVKMPKDEAINMMKRSMSIQKLEFPTFELRDSEFRQQVDFFLCRNNSLSWPNVHKLLIDMCIGLLSCDTLLWMPPYILLEIFDWLPYEEDVISIMHLVPQYKKVFLIEGVVNSMKKLIEQRARNIRKTVK